MNRVMLTQAEAQALVDAHDITAIVENDGEAELLAEHNPQLWGAYVHLLKIADGR